MKRLLLLLTLLLTLAPSALAWNESPELAAFASTHCPDHILLDGQLYPETALLLLETPAGETVLAGCSLTPSGWRISLSTPLPEGMSLRINSPDSVALYWESPVHGDLDFLVRLQPDGSWLIEEVDSYGHLLTYTPDGVFDEFASCCWGELLISRDITQVDWLTFPATVEDAAEHMDTSDRAIVAAETLLYDAPGGEAVARYYPGTPLLILSTQEDWLCVSPNGSPVSGWVQADALVLGDAQATAKYLTPDDLPLRWFDRAGVDAFVTPDGPLLARLTFDGYSSTVYAMGEWFDGWVHVFDRALPGQSGFIPSDKLRLTEYAENEPRG